MATWTNQKQPSQNASTPMRSPAICQSRFSSVLRSWRQSPVSQSAIFSSKPPSEVFPMSDDKRCNKCLKVKPSGTFNNGYTCCKDCRKAYAKEYRIRNQEVLAKKQHEYRSTEKGKKIKRASKSRYYASYPEKNQAHNMLAYAVRSGRITRLPCEVCGDRKSEAHHDDYGKPLDVRWLCSKHHREHHKSLLAS